MTHVLPTSLDGQRDAHERRASVVETSQPERLPANPLISIYMLAYRHERFIACAIEGVIAQECNFPIELIIGEDCSPDRTREIALTYQRRYPQLIRVLTAPNNVGPHANAARCRDACRGEFVAICEGDDYWYHPKKLQMQVQAMRTDPLMTLCHTEYDRRVGFRVKRNRHKSTHVGRVANGDAYVDLLNEWTVGTATAMYRRTIMENFRSSQFYNQRWPFGDYNLALFAAVHGHVGYIPTSTTVWRRAPGSASNSGPAKSLAMHLAATECRRLFMNTYPVDAKAAETIERSIQEKSMRLAFWANRLDVFEPSAAWLVEHGYEVHSLVRQLERRALQLRVPVAVLTRARTALRAVAEYDPRPGSK